MDDETKTSLDIDDSAVRLHAECAAVFGSRVLNDKQAEAVRLMRDEYTALLIRIRTLIPPGRERSVAEANLEQSALWAVKAISRATK